MSTGAASPFSPRAALALVGFGALVFVALLWLIGAGMTGGSANDGGGHVGGKGLNGYAALAGLLEKRGYPVRRTRSDDAFEAPGLLVLTPPHDAKPETIDAAIESHRYAGPTLLILPKWQASRARGNGSRDGWVHLTGAGTPGWSSRLSAIDAPAPRIDQLGPSQAHWTAAGQSGALAAPQAVQSASSRALAPLVEDGTGKALAGYQRDSGFYPVLANAAGIDPGNGEDENIYPVVVVAEPDLFNNYGLADRSRAMLALALVRAATGDDGAMPVSFDLTLNGHGRSANLLTLAFTPPFLAATLCLLLAALVVGWRAFLRFGPPQAPGRVIAFGKRALVTNAAGLIRRTRRFHLVTGPYAAAARDRLVRALALARRADPAASEEAIDRALAARQPDSTPFSTPYSSAAARLRAARRPHDIVKAAQHLHALERTLIR